MKRSVLKWLAVSTVAVTQACGPGMINNDAGDSGRIQPDVTSNDGGTDATPTDSGGGGAVCDQASIVDLNARGTRNGVTTRYTGNNSSANGTQQITPPMSCTSGRAIRQVAHSYRTGSMPSVVDVSTAVDGTDQDTVVWILDRCALTGATAIDCNDDLNADVPQSTAGTIRGPVAANTTLTIIVATYADTNNGDPGGAYALEVRERPAVASGGACDPRDIVDVCAAGFSCVGPGANGRCVADGTQPLTRCRPGTTNRCDNGLVCGEPNDSGLQYCFRTAQLNMACNFESSECPTGSTCVINDYGNEFEGLCVTDGARGGYCDSTTACTGGLTCSDQDQGGTCQATLNNGDMCDPAERENTCPTNSTCVVNAAGMGTCRADGTTAGGSCRASTTGDAGVSDAGTGSGCDSPLVCSAATDGFCSSTVQSGACIPRFGTNRCANNAVCAASGFLTGTCRTPTNEPTTANDTPQTAGSPVTLPAAINGTLSSANDIDCYALALTANQSLYVETNDGAGGCFPMVDTYLEVFNSSGVLIGENDDTNVSVCSAIDGTRNGSPLRMLPAGNYTVCVSVADGTGGRYYLNMEAR